MNFGGTIRVNKIGFCLICGVIIIFIIYLTPGKVAQGRPTIVNLKSLLLAAIEAAENGGKEVIKALNDTLRESKGKTKEGVNIPVTNADYRSHCVMFHGFTEIFPTLKVISEEKKDRESCDHIPSLDIKELSLNLAQLPDEKVDGSKISVWIDPLDATKEYTEKLLEYVTTMVCIAYEGRPIIGVIHKPFGTEPRTQWAWVNKGTSFPYQKIKESPGPNIVIVSRSHSGNVNARVKAIFGPDVRTIEAGGSGFKSLEVAVGNVTAYAHVTEISKWDICAGDAIITALGGRFTDLNDAEINYSPETEFQSKTGILAAPLQKHTKFIKNAQEISD